MITSKISVIIVMKSIKNYSRQPSFDIGLEAVQETKEKPVETPVKENGKLETRR